MKKDIKFALSMVLVFSVSGCVVAQPGHRYQRDYNCTQVQEANGECEVRATPEHKHQKHHKDQTQYGGYKSADGVTMLTRDGVTLPACGEVGGSQADNGNTCWF